MLYYLKTGSGDYTFHNVEANFSQDPVKVQTILSMIAQAKALTEAPASAQRDAQYATFKAAAQAMVVGAKINRNKVDIDLSSATYGCAWDGVSPYVITLFGTFPATGISFMGWPQTDTPPPAPAPLTQAQIDAMNAAAAAKQAAQDQWRANAQTQMALGLAAYQAWVSANPYPA